MGDVGVIQIIIPTATFGPRVDGLLEDLAREVASGSKVSLRVAVVDNEAVHDVSERVIRGGAPIAHPLPSPTNGPAINRNRGAHWSDAPWLVFLDDDVRIPAGWLAALIAILRRSDVADLIGGGIGSQEPRNVFSQAAEDFVVRHREYPEGWFLAAAHLIVKREAFVALEGFDTGFDYGGEDWDLCRRAHAMGLRVETDATIAVAHANATSWRQLRRKAVQYGRANAFLDADTLFAEAPAPESSEPHQETLASSETPRIPLIRRLRWCATEYRVLRTLGRSPVRAARSTVLQAAWMRVYLASYREALETARAARAVAS